MKRLCVWLMAGVLASLAGCATPTKMAFQDDSDKATTGAPVYLMTVTVKNDYHESYQPRLFIVHVEKAGAKDAADKLNFKMDDPGKAEEDDSREKGNSYLLRMRLPARFLRARGASPAAPASSRYGGSSSRRS